MRGIAMRRFGFFIALICSLIVASCSNSEFYSDEEIKWTWIPYDSDLLRISGRSFEQDDHVVLSWSATSVTIAFVGTSLEAKIGTNRDLLLDVLVDGNVEVSAAYEITYADGNPVTIPIVSDLPYGEHVVTLYKKSEGFVGDWYFYGVRVFGRIPKDIVPEPAERKIEFIGNSITCGCDVVAPGFGLAFDPVNEDSYYSYAGQMGRILGAEIHTICYSGHGVYINVDGSKDELLPIAYERSGFFSTAPNWNHESWHPDAIVIGLGTNDYASNENDSAQFVNAMIAFVQKLRSYHPDAKIVLLDGPMLTGLYMEECRRALDAAKQTLENQGLNGIYRFSFEPRGDSPSYLYFHPTKIEALEDATRMSAWMRSEFGWD